MIRGEFGAGRLSYAKVRALTRIATPDTEAGLAELAGPMTGNQLERFAGGRIGQSAQPERFLPPKWAIEPQDWMPSLRR